MAVGIIFGRDPLHEALLQILRQITTLTDVISELAKEQQKMIADIGALQQQVQQNTSVEGSAVALINGLAQKLNDAKNDPVAVQSLIDQLHASANDLATAVAANTAGQEMPPVGLPETSPA